MDPLEYLPVLVPIFAVGLAYGLAAATFRRLPTGFYFVNFHVIAYFSALLLNMLILLLMGIDDIDWYVDDASIFLAIFFSGLGSIVCLTMALPIWLLGRRKFSPNVSRVGRYIVNFVVTAPYLAVAWIFLFYSE